MNFILEKQLFLVHSNQEKAMKIAKKIHNLAIFDEVDQFEKYDKFNNMYKSYSKGIIASNNFDDVILAVIDCAFAICRHEWVVAIDRDYKYVKLYLSNPTLFEEQEYNIIHSASISAEAT